MERIWCSNAAGVQVGGCAADRGLVVRHEVPSFLLFRNLEYPHGAGTVRALQVPTPPALLHQFFPISLCRNHLILGTNPNKLLHQPCFLLHRLTGSTEAACAVEHVCGSCRIFHAEICLPGEISTVGGQRTIFRAGALRGDHNVFRGLHSS